jgi:hypothetical protein
MQLERDLGVLSGAAIAKMQDRDRVQSEAEQLRGPPGPGREAGWH